MLHKFFCYFWSIITGKRSKSYVCGDCNDSTVYVACPCGNMWVRNRMNLCNPCKCGNDGSNLKQLGADND